MNQPTIPLALHPVASADRLHLLDVLRGFALLGVLISNVIPHFSGYNLLNPAAKAVLPTAPADGVVYLLCMFFVHGKFLTLFSFLFGLSFALQLERAEEQKVRILPYYLRRLTTLLGIGLVHAVLLWFADILTMYALAGFLLLLFYRRTNRTLLIWSAILSVVIYSLLLSIYFLVAPSPDELRAGALAAGQLPQEEKAFRAFASGSLPAVVQENLYFLKGVFTSPAIVLFLTSYLGLFLLGLWVGRHQFLQAPDQYQPFWRRVQRWGLVLGLLGNAVFVTTSYLTETKVISFRSGWNVFTTPLVWAGLALSFFYLATLVRLYQKTRWQQRLLMLAPVGRMSLTNYLMQTIVCLLIFYGYGLSWIGQVGPLLCLPLAVALFVLQIAFSHWWLSRFRFGPMEWLWRSLTYGKWQPMTR